MNLRALNATTPAVAAIDFVPLRTAPLPAEALTAIVAVESVTTLPSASWIFAVGWVVNATRFVKPAAPVVATTLVAVPNLRVTVSVAEVRPSAE